MTVEVLLARAGSAQAVARLMARRVHETCPPPVPGAEVDRIEVLVGQAAVDADDDGAGPRARYTIPAEVSLVTRDALEAAPNAIPAVSRVPVTAAIGVRATVETVTPVPPAEPYSRASVQLGGVEAPGLPPGTLDGVLAPTSAPLGVLWSGLGLPDPTSASTDVVDGSVVLRWDAAGDPVDRLAGTPHGAGVFLSGDDVVAMLRARLGDALAKLPDLVELTLAWDPRGAVPHIRITALAAVAVVHVDVDLELVLGWTVPVLRARALWSTEIRTGPFLPILDEIAEAAFDSAVSDALDPASFGAASAGDHRFTLDSALPNMELAGIAVVLDALVASPAGMLFGAHLVPPTDLPGPVHIASEPLGAPTRVQLCSVNARTGSGARNTAPLTVDTATSFGHATITDYGHWCEFSVEPPELKGLVDVRVLSPGKHMDLWARVPYREAQKMQSPLRIVARSTGGIRLIDLGLAPEITTDADGVITSGAVDLYVDDCLHLPDGFGRGIDWGSVINGEDSPRWGVDDFRPAPPEWPEWIDVIAGLGVSSQLVTLIGLEPGELVRFRSQTHAIDATADSTGRAYVPVLVSLGRTTSEARLERAGQRSLDGHVRVRVRTAAFVVAEPASDAAEVNPQPLPPHPDEIAERLGLDGVVDAVPIPGFEGAPVFVAILSDGQQLLVARTRDEQGLRVAGTFSGPIGHLDVVGAGFEVRDGERAVRLVQV